MKTLGRVFLVLLLLHVFAALGFVAWLFQSGRLDADRANRVVEMFKKTVSEEKAEAEKVEAAARAVADQEQRLNDEQTRGDKRSAAEALALEDQAIRKRRAELDRQAKEIADMRQNLLAVQTQLDQRKKEVKRQQDALTKQLDDLKKQMNDEGFARAVAMYEGLDPGQTKQIFQSLISQGQHDQVVTYLAAMKPRKAIAVLGEFQTVQEVAQAADLAERLRARGSDLVKQLESAG